MAADESGGMPCPLRSASATQAVHDGVAKRCSVYILLTVVGMRVILLLVAWAARRLAAACLFVGLGFAAATLAMTALEHFSLIAQQLRGAVPVGFRADIPAHEV